MNLNKVIIVGRATRNPDLKTTQSGTPVVQLGIATSRKWTDKQGKASEETEFHNVVFWSRLAEIVAQYVVKGGLLLVEGHLQTREWEKDGQKRKTTEIVADSMQLGPRPASKVDTISLDEDQETEVDSEELPF